MRTGGHPERSWDVQDTFLGDLQAFPLGLCRSSVTVVRPIGWLSEPAVLLVETPDLVHHGVRDHLRPDGGQGRVVIVRLNMRYHSSHKTSVIVTFGVNKHCEVLVSCSGTEIDNFRSSGTFRNLPTI